MVGQGPPSGRFASRFPLPASRSPLLALAIAGRSPRFPRGPSGAAGGRGSARRGAGREAGDVRDSAGMHCPRTPADSRGPSAQGCAGGADAGWPFSCLLLLTPGFLPSAPPGPPSAFAPLLRRSGHAKRSRSGRPKDGPKALALRSRPQRETEASVELMVGQGPPYDCTEVGQPAGLTESSCSCFSLGATKALAPHQP